MQQLAYGTAIFLSAACGLIVKIVVGRLLAPYVGMSLYTWTAIRSSLGVWTTTAVLLNGHYGLSQV